MKTTIKTTVVLTVAMIAMGGVAAFCDDTNNVWAVQPENLTPTGKVNPTTTYYTNNLQSVTAIQQSRVQQQGGCPKGAVINSQSGPDIQIRPNKAFQEQNPLVSQQHLWDVVPPQSQ
jgi:hypothetical protein